MIRTLLRNQSWDRVCLMQGVLLRPVKKKKTTVGLPTEKIEHRKWVKHVSEKAKREHWGDIQVRIAWRSNDTPRTGGQKEEVGLMRTWGSEEDLTELALRPLGMGVPFSSRYLSSSGEPPWGWRWQGWFWSRRLEPAVTSVMKEPELGWP